METIAHRNGKIDMKNDIVIKTQIFKFNKNNRMSMVFKYKIDWKKKNCYFWYCNSNFVHQKSICSRMHCWIPLLQNVSVKDVKVYNSSLLIVVKLISIFNDKKVSKLWTFLASLFCPAADFHLKMYITIWYCILFWCILSKSKYDTLLRTSFTQ